MVWRYLKQLKIKLLYDPAIPLVKQGSVQCVHTSTVHSSHRVDTVQVPLMREWINKVLCFDYEILVHLKEGTPAMSYSVEECWRYWAQWNKPGTLQYCLNWITLHSKQQREVEFCLLGPFLRPGSGCTAWLDALGRGGFCPSTSLDPWHWRPRLEQSELSPAKAFVGINFCTSRRNRFSHARHHRPCLLTMNLI